MFCWRSLASPPLPPTLIRPWYKLSPPWHFSLRLGFQLPQHILEQQAWLQISLSGFSIPAESSHWTPSLLCHAELATKVGNKNRHTGRQVSQALSQLQACCDRGVCVFPTCNFPQGHRSGRRADTESLLPPLGSAKSSHVAQDQSRKTTGLEETRLSSLLDPQLT